MMASKNLILCLVCQSHISNTDKINGLDNNQNYILNNKSKIFCYLLDVNISMQNIAAEKKPLNHAVKAINYYAPIEPSISTKLIFLWLVQLSLLIGLSIDLKRTKLKCRNHVTLDYMAYQAIYPSF